MQKTGKIVSIDPAGDYTGKFGLVYTFQMTIDSDAGPLTGEIGSKAQAYPMSAGQDITVEVTSGEHGTKFKKVNQQQVGGQQQPPQQRQAPQDKPDWDKIAEGKVRHGIVCAAIQSGQVVCADEQAVDAWVEYVMGRKANTGFFNANEQAAHDAADGVGPGGDDISF